MVKEQKKEDKVKKEGIAESFLGGIPILGNLVKELGKTETFKKKFEEVDKKIEENLKKGAKKGWSFQAMVSTRPILKEVKKETTEFVIEDDYCYGKNGEALTVAVKVPRKGVGLRIKEKYLNIEGENFIKKIELPGYFNHIRTKKYRKGILVLELTK